MMVMIMICVNVLSSICVSIVFRYVMLGQVRNGWEQWMDCVILDDRFRNIVKGRNFVVQNSGKLLFRLGCVSVMLNIIDNSMMFSIGLRIVQIQFFVEWLQVVVILCSISVIRMWGMWKCGFLVWGCCGNGDWGVILDM